MFSIEAQIATDFADVIGKMRPDPDPPGVADRKWEEHGSIPTALADVFLKARYVSNNSLNYLVTFRKTNWIGRSRNFQGSWLYSGLICAEEMNWAAQ